MSIDELLGIEPTNNLTRRARQLRENDRQLVHDLVKQRKALRLTQEEVARRMDTSQATVARIESGKRDLRQSTIRRYAMAVEVVVHHHVRPENRDLVRSTAILNDYRDQVGSPDGLSRQSVGSDDPHASLLASWANSRIRGETRERSGRR